MLTWFQTWPWKGPPSWCLPDISPLKNFSCSTEVNLHTITFTHFKCVIQRFLVNLQTVKPSPPFGSRRLSPHRRAPRVHLHLPAPRPRRTVLPCSCEFPSPGHFPCVGPHRALLPGWRMPLGAQPSRNAAPSWRPGPSVTMTRPSLSLVACALQFTLTVPVAAAGGARLFPFSSTRLARLYVVSQKAQVGSCFF